MFVVEVIRSRQRRGAGLRCAKVVVTCNVLFSGVRDEGREQANETESGGIRTVYGVAGRRRRRCSSETRVALATAERNAVEEQLLSLCHDINEKNR